MAERTSITDNNLVIQTNRETIPTSVLDYQEDFCYIGTDSLNDMFNGNYNFSLMDIYGEVLGVTNDVWHGPKVLVLEKSATWCIPCVRKMYTMAGDDCYCSDELEPYLDSSQCSYEDTIYAPNYCYESVYDRFKNHTDFMFVQIL